MKQLEPEYKKHLNAAFEGKTEEGGRQAVKGLLPGATGEDSH